jgi:hypothetical protein
MLSLFFIVLVPLCTNKDDDDNSVRLTCSRLGDTMLYMFGLSVLLFRVIRERHKSEAATVSYSCLLRVDLFISIHSRFTTDFQPLRNGRRLKSRLCALDENNTSSHNFSNVHDSCERFIYWLSFTS